MSNHQLKLSLSPYVGLSLKAWAEFEQRPVADLAAFLLERALRESLLNGDCPIDLDKAPGD